MTAREILTQSVGPAMAGHLCRLGRKGTQATRNAARLHRTARAEKQWRRWRKWVHEVIRIDEKGRKLNP